MVVVCDSYALVIGVRGLRFDYGQDWGEERAR